MFQLLATFYWISCANAGKRIGAENSARPSSWLKSWDQNRLLVGLTSWLGEEEKAKPYLINCPWAELITKPFRNKGERRYTSNILELDTRQRFRLWSLYPQWRGPRNHWKRGVGWGSKGGWGCSKEEKILRPCRELNRDSTKISAYYRHSTDWNSPASYYWCISYRPFCLTCCRLLITFQRTHMKCWQVAG